MFILYALAFTIIAFLVLRKKTRWDPRLVGSRLASKGLSIFLGGTVFVLIAEAAGQKSPAAALLVVGNFICIVGFITMLCGFGKNIKILYDPSLESGQGINLDSQFDYIQCPHCQKAKMMIEDKTVKCPVCKQKTRV